MPSALTALLARHHTSPHEGSKRRFTQHTDPAADRPSQIAAALAWSARTGRPVPPYLRFRRPLAPPAPLSSRQRLAAYRNRPGAGTVVPAGRLTPAQARRLRHKHGRPEYMIVAGFDPALPEGPRRPGTPAQLRRAAKNARQRARHQNRQPEFDATGLPR